MIEHPRPESQGNRSLLVVVDSHGSYTDTSIVDETVLVALHHFGLPFRLHDLAKETLTSKVLEGCAAVVIAQARLGDRLSAGEADLLAEAVRGQGLGLVNMDGHLHPYPGGLLELMELDVEPIPLFSDRLRIGNETHFIAHNQRAGELVDLHRPLPFAQVKRIGSHVSTLVEAVMGKDQLIYARHHAPETAYEPGHYPAVLAAPCGRGRVVQFTWSPRIWLQDFLGHGMGLDGFFWRAIVWAARKPFVAQLMPPMVTFRIDDAVGRHDLRYAKVIAERRHRPLVSCFVHELPDRLMPFMRTMHEKEKVDWDAHALSYYQLIPFQFGVGEYDRERLSAIFEQVDDWYAKLGFEPPGTAYFHWGECGVRVLEFLKARGRRFLFCPYHLGQLKPERLFPNFWPYRLNSFFYDYAPEDPDIYVVGATLPRHLMAHDMLTGCTTWAGERPANDMEKAADRASTGVGLALESGFFAEILTHEQKLGVLSLDEIDRWIAGIDERLSGYDPRLVGHERAVTYTKARDESWISASSASAKGAIELSMAGESSIAQELAVFVDEGDGVRRRWAEIPAFEGAIEVSL